MTTSRFSLFPAAKYIKIEPEKFMNAVTNGDSAAIDCMLELKKQGCELDINGTHHTDNPLKELLKRKDFENARKLLQAGADTGYNTKEYFGDGWDEWNILRHDLFDEFASQGDVIEFLRHEARRNSFEKIKKEYENAKELLETYQKMLETRPYPVSPPCLARGVGMPGFSPNS